MVEVPLVEDPQARLPESPDPFDELAVPVRYPIPAEVSERYPGSFLMKVPDESMNQLLPNGAYALIDPCSSASDPGRPYAVSIGGGKATIKRVNRLNNGYELIPDSSDPTYRRSLYDYGVEGTEPVSVLGRVVWYCIPVDWEL
jgi:repressor LexA